MVEGFAQSRDQWLPVCSLPRLTEAGIVAVRVAGVDLALISEGGRVMACERACPHEQADLACGRLLHGRIACPRHEASFSLDDGTISDGWPSRPLRFYPVRVERGEVFINAASLILKREN
ncbi:Rieske (2Fe-2S) protein [Rhodopseudomonas sp. B29]|uniref:Rieske (2Fe-2S) protein n=1 Tax=Rhodopseudomonas sp. B29 TaxID=95607 RepID=UPI000346B340|nr:Rieske (2Fe-2S) protein [Rhodopseudomonas sp. B29]